MRKILSIPLALIILFSGLTVNLATHYCGGVIVATKVSLSDENATCGMEDHENDQTGDIYTDLCCVNTTSSFTFNTNYIPSVIISKVSKDQVLNIDLPVIHAAVEEPSTSDLYIIKSSSGINNPNRVEQDVLCIFRI